MSTLRIRRLATTDVTHPVLHRRVWTPEPVALGPATAGYTSRPTYGGQGVFDPAPLRVYHQGLEFVGLSGFRGLASLRYGLGDGPYTVANA